MSTGMLADMYKALRIEWCCSWVRAMHFLEEVELLNEEMQWVLAFLDWEASHWEERATECIWALASVVAVGPAAVPTFPVIPESSLNEGLQAYAHHQVVIWCKLFTCFATQWKDVLTFIRLSNDTLADPGVQDRPSYLTPAPPITLL
jgi:hypothetical protein